MRDPKMERKMRFSRRVRNLSFSVNELEKRLVMASPVMNPIANVQVPATKTLMVPVSSTDADGDALTYTVTSDNAQVQATIRTGHPWLKMSIANYGDMVFQLFDDIAPVTVQKISGLVNDGFYDGLKIHRIVKDFVIQGGDPLGTGTGGPGFKFGDEFSPDAIFSGNGQLAMANSGKDTNGSQFFVTVGSQRFLDFNHTIYGQLVQGFDVLAALNNATTTPTIVISSMQMVTDTTDTVLELKAPATGTTHFTVTATDPAGNTDSKTFTATAVTDTVNDPPILGPVNNVKSYTNEQITIPLTSFDYENDAVTYAAAFGETPAPGTFVVNGNNIVITPKTDYTGTFVFRVGVRQSGATNRGSTSDPYDIQDIKIQIADPFLTTSKTVSVSESASLANTVIGTFKPSYAKAVSDYEVTIDWGNNVTSPGQLTKLADGTFEVRGGNSYNRFGTFPVNIAVRDKIDDVSATISSTANVTDAPISASFVAPARNPGSGLIQAATIAQITDSNVNGLLSDLSATINWGDGSTTTGVITKQGGVYLVSGSKTYAATGTFNVLVNVSSLGGRTTLASGSVLVANAAPVISPIANQTTLLGTGISIPVHGTDSDTWQTLSFSLGSGTPSGVSIDSQTGLITVASTVNAGTYTINVDARDNGTPALSSNTTFNLTVESPVVNQPPVIAWAGTPPTSVLQLQTWQASGTVQDTIGAGLDGAVVNYGDGSGYQLISVAANGTFSLSHQYSSSGNYLIRVRAVDLAGMASEIQTSVNVINPVTQPTSVSITRSSNGQIAGIRLYFSGPLNATSAQRSQNYQLITNPGRDKKYGTKDDRRTTIQSVTYDAATQSVIIKPRGRLILRGSQSLRLQATGLMNASNVLIDGSRNGVAGGPLWLNVTAKSANFI